MTVKDALREAHQLLRKAVPAKRKLPHTDSVLAQTYHAAMVQWDQQKADGMPLAERLAALEKILRAAWPFTRTWHYGCDACSDTGWEPGVCRNGSCGRPFKLPKQRGDDWTGRGRCTEGHTFVRPCSCAKGRAFWQQLMHERSPEDAITTAARTSKSMTRLGR